jgi:hypothetical protein
MGILAINAMNIEGQVGTAAITPPASNLQANVDFATELDRKLQVKTNPTLTSGVSEPESAPGKSSSSRDGNQSRQAVGPSVSLAAIVTAVPVTEHSKSAGSNTPTPNPGQAATVSSNNATSLSPEIASTITKDSAQAADERDAETADPRANTTDGNPVPAQAALQNEAVSKANLNASILGGKVTQPSAGSLKTEEPKDKNSKASSANSAATAEASSTLQSSCLAQPFAARQDRPAYVAGSTSGLMNALDATSPSRLDKGLQSARGEPLAPVQNVTTMLEPQDHSSGPEARAGQQQAESSPESQSNAQDAIGPKHGQQSRDFSRSIPLELATVASTSPKTEASQDKDSKASSANKAAPAEVSSTLQPPRAVQAVTSGQEGATPVTGSAPTPAGIETLQATSPSTLNKEVQGAGVEPTAKTENPQDKLKATTTPLANITTRAEDGSSPQPSRLVQGVITGQEGSAPVKGSASTWERIDPTSPSDLDKGFQAAGAETRAPLHQGTTQLEQQGSSSAPEARTRQQAESGPESQSSAYAATGPPAQISTLGPYSPDFSPSMPFELTKAVSTGRVDEPQNSNRIKNSQGDSQAASGANSDAAPDGTPASLVQDPAQTNDIETGSSVHDTKQADTSADNKGGEAAQDLTKAADGKGSLPKASTDPALTPQLIPEGSAEAGRASPEAAGASQGRGEPGSASLIEGYQANAETVVRSARFTQQAGNAEMQVRLRSEALGPIDVHTIVKGSDIGASIRVEAHDTQVMLANQLSQLERALSERNLRVEHLDVLQGSVSGGTPEGTGSDNSHGSPSEPRQSFSSYSPGQTYTSLPEAPTVSEDWGLGLSTTRINLRV